MPPSGQVVAGENNRPAASRSVGPPVVAQRMDGQLGPSHPLEGVEGRVGFPFLRKAAQDCAGSVLDAATRFLSLGEAASAAVAVAAAATAVAAATAAACQ